MHCARVVGWLPSRLCLRLFLHRCGLPASGWGRSAPSRTTGRSQSMARGGPASPCPLRLWRRLLALVPGHRHPEELVQADLQVDEEHLLVRDPDDVAERVDHLGDAGSAARASGGQVHAPLVAVVRYLGEPVFEELQFGSGSRLFCAHVSRGLGLRESLADSGLRCSCCGVAGVPSGLATVRWGLVRGVQHPPFQRPARVVRLRRVHGSARHRPPSALRPWPA